MSTSFCRSLLLCTLLAAALTGCGGGGGGDRGGSGGGGGGNPPTFTVGGTVSGLNGTVVFRNNGADDLTVSANGAFAFKTALATGTAYNVTVRTQPTLPAQDCVITNGSGTANANVANVTVTCSTLASAELQADADVRSATLTWTKPASASSFDLYVSSVRNCDISNVTSCPDGARFVNVTSPHTVGELRNGQAYFFRIETAHANGARGISNEAAARPNVLAFNGDIKAIAPAADGGAYLGGDFTEVGITTGSAVPLDPSTGRLVMPDFPIVDGIVHAVAADGAGGWYIGGAFTQVGGASVHNLAHILANGTVDLNFSQGREFGGPHSGAVRAIAVSGSTVHIGGSFMQINGQSLSRLAAIGADGRLLSWSPNADADVFALAVSGDMVYAGGSFQTINGQSHAHLAAINAGGELVLERAPHVSGTTATVFALVVADSTIFVGGNFSGMDNLARADLGAFSAVDGKPLLNWIPRATDANPSVETEVRALAVSGSTVFVGGSFSHINDTPRADLAAVDAPIDANGIAHLQPWDPGVNGEVHALAVSGTTIYAGGTFTQVGGAERKHLAAIDTNGTLLPWNPSANNDALTLAVSGGTVYAGGAFTGLDSTARGRLAEVSATGALLPWNPSADLAVRALVVSGETVYVGGQFVNVNGQSRSRLAAIDPNGTLLPWAPSANNAVFALAIIPGSTVYAGGQFTEISGQPRSRLAAIAAVGTLIEGAVVPWRPNPNNTVHALAVSGGTVYVGGEFTSVSDGVTTFARFRLAAIDAQLTEVGDDLIAVVQKSPLVNDGMVSALAISGGTVYVGGSFTLVDSNQRFSLAAFGAIGSPDGGVLRLSWTPRANQEVFALAVSGGTVYAGGQFGRVEGVTRNSLAAISPGGVVLQWDPSANAPVSALAASGSTVYVGGSFGTLGESSRPRFGAVSADGTGEVVP